MVERVYHVSGDGTDEAFPEATAFASFSAADDDVTTSEFDDAISTGDGEDTVFAGEGSDSIGR